MEWKLSHPDRPHTLNLSVLIGGLLSISSHGGEASRPCMWSVWDLNALTWRLSIPVASSQWERSSRACPPPPLLWLDSWWMAAAPVRLDVPRHNLLFVWASFYKVSLLGSKFVFTVAAQHEEAMEWAEKRTICWANAVKQDKDGFV